MSEFATIEDLLHAINSGEPRSSVFSVASSYLTSVALADIIKAEEEYAALVATPDALTTNVFGEPIVYRKTVDGVAVEYDPNTERDDRIAEIVSKYPHVVEPEPDENGIIVPISERRPPAGDLDWSLIEQIYRPYRKGKRDSETSILTVTTSTGKTFDADEKSQARMSRALQVSDITGETETEWIMADNTTSMVTKAELQEAFVLSVKAQRAVWFADLVG